MRGTHTVKVVLVDNETGVEYGTGFNLLTADSIEAAKDGIIVVYDLLREKIDAFPFHVKNEE